MSPLTIKICGLRDAASLDAALGAGADMVGFVFFARSPRHVDPATARELARRVDGRARTVALTVDADDAALAAVVAALDPDILQLHGDESPDRIAAIRARFGRPVMRALAIHDRHDLGRVAEIETTADRLLFDARAPSGAGRPGGNGASFDWTLLAGLRPRKPWMLAGGLGTANIVAALAATRAPGIDVSSGVETAPGRKDPAEIVRFIRAARAAVASALGERHASAERAESDLT